MLNLPESFETKRLLVRQLHDSDARAIYDGYASIPETTRYISWPTHKSIADTYHFLKLKDENWRLGKDYAYGIEEKASRTLIGGVGAINEDGKVAIGYILNSAFTGHGYATEAVVKLTDILKDLPQVWRIWALSDIDNIASHRVLEKAGFEREGVLKSWYKFVNQNNAIKDCVFYRLPFHQRC